MTDVEGRTDMEAEEVVVLNTDHVDRKVWLVKLPDFLIEKWSKLEENDVDLGSVRIYEAAAGKPSRVTLHLSKDPRMMDLPKDYEMSFMKQSKTNYVFSEEDNAAQAVEGRIENECHVKPMATEEYRQLMKSRNAELNKPKRTIQMIDSLDHESGIAVGLIPHIHEHKLLSKTKKISIDNRKERLPKEELRDLLFTAFEKYTHWHLKGLIEFTKQPNIYLREVLNEIGIYNKRGPYKNTYTLKPEYKATMNIVSGSQQRAGPAAAQPREMRAQENDGDMLEEEEEEEEEFVEESF